MTNIPFIPESAPFNAEQRAWLNGFLAGLFSQVPGGAPQLNAAPPKAGEPLVILFGSQTGSAEGLAKKLAKESESRGFAPKLFALNDYEQANLSAASKAVIISSTWGDGEPPDNAVNFWNWIKADSAPRLENLNFAVLGLGDKNYSDFCGASKKFDERLAALGAKRLAPRGECDVDYEAPANSWIDGLWDKLGSANGAPASGPASSNGATKPAGSETGAPKAYGKSNPFPAKLLKNVLLNKPAKKARTREALLVKYIFFNHPFFKAYHDKTGSSNRRIPMKIDEAEILGMGERKLPAQTVMPLNTNKPCTARQSAHHCLATRH